MVGPGFDDPLTLPKGSPPVAKGPFEWDVCYLMSATIVQSDPAQDQAAGKDFSAFTRLAIPVVKQRGKDPDNPNETQTIWQLELKQAEHTTRPLANGRALGIVVALVGGQGGAIEMVHWSDPIDLR